MRRPRHLRPLAAGLGCERGELALDGGGPASFVAIPPPRDDEVEAILRRIVRRAAKALVGLEEDLGCEADALAALQAAKVERRIRYPDPFPHARRSAFVEGFSLHAGVRIHANDRLGWSGCAATLRGHRSRCGGCPATRPASSSTG